MLRCSLLFAASLGVAGCLQDDPDHCANRDGDATCAELGGGAFCSICEAENNGCVSEQPSAACHEPGEDTGASGSSSSTTTTTDGTDASTTDAPECMGMGLAMACEDPLRPFCNEGMCTSCDAPPELCANAFPSTPACLVGQACVECLFDDDCGPGTGCDGSYECSRCTDHSQCDSEACNLFSGECFAAAEVFRVSNARSGCNQPDPVEGDGSLGNEFCSITAALQDFDVDTQRALLVKSTTTDYQDEISITTGRTLAIIGENRPDLVGNEFTIRSVSEGLVSLSRVTVRNAVTQPVTCTSGGRLFLDDVLVRDSPAGGVFAEGCRLLRLTKSRVFGNDEFGISIADDAGPPARGRLEMFASAVSGNGTSTNDGRGLIIGRDIDFEIVASSIVDNVSMGGGSAPPPTNLECPDENDGVVRNSIVAGPGGAGTIDCAWASFEYSVIDEATGAMMNSAVLGEDGVPGFDSAWFADPDLGVVTLTSPQNTPFGGVALWRLGDPRYDINDPDLRTPLDQTPEFAGADQP